jgi:hypothetical protein
VELPTYTNIWKIEKRLYKLYDFRLPMPLPVGQIAAFLAIAAPYMLLLAMIGMPFSHTWVWLYVLPPGVLAWLVTRPVLEGKRLPELVLSQLRYLGEPRTWCRMAPLAEKDQVYIVARAWRSADYVRPDLAAAPEGLASASPADSAMAPKAAEIEVAPAAAVSKPAEPSRSVPAASTPTASKAAAPLRPAATAPTPDRAPAPVGFTPGRPRPARPGRAPGQPPPRETVPASGRTTRPARDKPDWAEPDAERLVRARSAPSHLEPVAIPANAAADGRAAEPGPVPDVRPPAPAALAAEFAGGPAAATETDAAASAVGVGVTEVSRPRWPDAPAGPPRAHSPVVRVSGDDHPVGPLNLVERALRTPPGNGSPGRREPVVVVPGGHRPGRPDQVQRDQARVRLALPGPARVIVLGCTAGAGQTIVTLLTGQLLASLRGEAVAVLDLSQGEGSLTERARSIPVLLPSQRAGAEPGGPRAGSAGERGLQVVTGGRGTEDAGELINSVVARYPLTLADPDAARVPKSLRAADQLVLVAPASAEAAGSLAMTLEWLEAHDHGRLAEAAITVLNGVSALTTQHASKAAAVASGRCRAIVQVPWDERLREATAQPLGTSTVLAYTALAGVLMSALADTAMRSAVR